MLSICLSGNDGTRLPLCLHPAVTFAAPRSSDQPQVLHARTGTGTGRQLAHLVAACHLIFSVGCDNMHLALDMLPPLLPAGAARPSGAASWMALGGSESSSSLASLAGGGGGGGARSR